MNIHGDFDNVAFRSFLKEEEAEEFLNGKIRFGCIYKYQKIEEIHLRDTTEGNSHYYFNEQEYRGKFPQTTPYILCFHRTLDSAVKSNFGKYIIKIKHPRMLANEINEALIKKSNGFWGGVEGAFVQYNKGDIFERRPENFEESKLIYCQKPLNFHPENEFRIIILSRKNIGEIYLLDVKNVSSCCEYLHD